MVRELPQDVRKPQKNQVSVFCSEMEIGTPNRIDTVVRICPKS